MGFIYCDEHGNTGEHLLDRRQPVFALASNDFSPQEAEELLHIVRSQGAAEVKFKTLRKTPAGQARLARLLTDPRLNSSRVAAYSLDKRFMVVTKMVDLVMETLMEKIGEDLHERGTNLATANMLYACLPVYCGEESFDQLLQTFVNLVRSRTSEAARAYTAAGDRLRAKCNPQLRDFLEGFFIPDLIPVWLTNQPEDVLNPAASAVFVHIAAWGKRKMDRFTVIHDESKPIFQSRDMFLAMMAKENEGSRLVGYDRRKFLFPLRAEGLELRKSHELPQLQLADVCAGAFAHLMACQLSGQEDDLVKILRTCRCDEWDIGGMFATHDVTPEAMGTDGTGGINPIDPVADRIASGR